jgi:hypothetical protein
LKHILGGWVQGGRLTGPEAAENVMSKGPTMMKEEKEEE